jgi:phosphate transport system permease protein
VSSQFPGGRAVQPAAADVPVALKLPRTKADQIFRVILVACSSTVLVVITVIVIFLLNRAGPAWHHQGLGLITSDTWAPRSGHPSFGFLAALVGSTITGIIALIVAVPIGLATALAINEYLPRQLRRSLATLVDLLAAVPSIVFGLWGKFFLDSHLFLTVKWFGAHGDSFPLFRIAGTNYNDSLFEAGIVVGIMILPIITSISREVMSQTPREQCEAALALGGTRWGMVTDVVLPFSRNGIIGGAMLGLGRALGETIAVSMVLSADNRLTSHILQPGGSTVASLIVREFQGSSQLEQSALFVAGLTLFAVTLAINLGARAIVARGAQNTR